MHKRQLQYFLNACSLGGEIGSVIWEYKSKSKKLFTRCITGDKGMLGVLSCNSLYDFSNDTETELRLNWNWGKDFKIGIYDLAQLKKMISILDDTELKIVLDVDNNKVISMDINDGHSTMTYLCSDLSVINQVPAFKTLPDFETLIFTLTDSKKRFRSAIGVFEKDITFNVMENTKSKTKGLDEIIFCIGHSTSTPTNRVDVCFGSPRVGLDDDDHYYETTKVGKVFEILDMFGVVSTMEISNQGLARISNNRKYAPTNETKYGIRYDYYIVQVSSY
jgi:hypothetical protein|tara:strand:+ start:436 stop:1266 length:831 start_codon:yes stop_codon:yes gene_type:complete